MLTVTCHESHVTTWQRTQREFVRAPELVVVPGRHEDVHRVPDHGEVGGPGVVMVIRLDRYYLLHDVNLLVFPITSLI